VAVVRVERQAGRLVEKSSVSDVARSVPDSVMLYRLAPAKIDISSTSESLISSRPVEGM
jgi:hypothetical protein